MEPTFKKPTRKKAVKKVANATTPELQTYINTSDVNIFLSTGKLYPGDTIMLNELDASKILGITRV